MFEILVLGSGTSHGVPMIGCDCRVCKSTNPKNKRFRPSILIKTAFGNLLVDTGPEFRMQCLAFDVQRVDAVCITHTHADHIMGLDDIRRFNDISGREIPVYGTPEVLQDIARIYDYIFKVTQAGGGKPKLRLVELDPYIELFNIIIEPLQVWHGDIPVTAYRFETDSTAGARAAAYVTDVSQIPEQAMQRLHNLDLLILDAVRFEPHPTHFGLYQALEVVELLKPKQTLFTHLSHHYDHDEVNALLPENVRLAYDGQSVLIGA